MYVRARVLFIAILEANQRLRVREREREKLFGVDITAMIENLYDGVDRGIIMCQHCQFWVSVLGYYVYSSFVHRGLSRASCSRFWTYIIQFSGILWKYF